MRETVRRPSNCLSIRPSATIVTERNEPTDAELATDEALDAFIARDIGTGQHTSGAWRWTSTEPLAVVDQYGKVHGIQNLRVVHASIMPDCIRANTNVTTMMIAERVADFILAGK